MFLTHILLNNTPDIINDLMFSIRGILSLYIWSIISRFYNTIKPNASNKIGPLKSN